MPDKENPAIEPLEKRVVEITEDGSATLKLTEFDEQFHSIHGAVNESLHIYINAGLKFLRERECLKIAEVGFGTGLNAILTLQNQENREIEYHAIEAYPLKEEEYKQLNYNQFIDSGLTDAYRRMMQFDEGKWMEINARFRLKVSVAKIEDIHLENGEYDLVYFDAFGPATQPELWTGKIFEKIYQSMSKNSVLVTYCSKGAVKRAMKSAGFEVSGLPGPIGKREITRCLKK
jgi:tRNA U34 5-methylaminomethyl-2-thiouridine-forming methyltransferase MnmC